MSISIKFNEADVKRITGRLQRIGQELTSGRNSVFQWRLLLLNDYKEAIVAAMGSVNVTGGSAKIEGKGKVSFGSPNSVYWKALAPLTINLKQWSGESLSIWQASGQTKQAVRVTAETGFAGIDGGKFPEAYQKALNTEFGGVGKGWDSKGLDGFTDWPSRPLFTIANEAFKRNRENIVRQLQGWIHQTVLESGWGKS